MATVYGSNTSNMIGIGTGATAGDDDIFGWDQGNAAGNQGPASDADTLSGGGGSDLIEGGGGNDSLLGDDGVDDLFGGSGDDVLAGGAEGDFLDGGNGADTLVSDSGTGDLLIGGAGADRFETNGAAFNNVVYTINGVGVFDSYGDVISYHTSAAAIQYDGTTFSGGDAQGDVVVGQAYTLVGSMKGDTITAAGSFQRIYGLAGNDQILGAGFVSVFYGGDGNDTLQGFGGANLHGGLGNDDIIGTAGGFGTMAIFDATSLGVTVDLTLTGRQNTGAEGKDLLTDIVDLEGGAGADHFVGTAGANRLYGDDGNDTILAGAGDDSLVGGAGADRLNGGDGIDTVTFLNGVTLELARPAQNAGEALGDIYISIEVFAVQSGASILRGNGADNQFRSGYGDDVLSGAAGNDSLYASGGDDSLYGGSGNDTLDGGPGNDTMAGGLGDDTYVLDSLTDVITEQAKAGVDTVFTNLSGLTLASFGGASIENLQSSGYFGSDPVSLTGSAGANVIGFQSSFSSAKGRFFGLGGDDTLLGASGADLLSGGTGDDVLQGNGAADRLTGGRGADTFVFGTDFGSATDSVVDLAGRDVITDFGLGADKIDLRRIDPNHSAAGSGDQAFEFIGRAQFTGNLTDAAGRGEVRYVLLDKAGTANDRTFVFGAMHGDTGATFAVTLLGLHHLTVNDFDL